MANLNETAKWEDGVYQIETSDPVLGGPGGIANKQAEQLSNRTSWLKQQTENIQSNLSDVATSGSYNDLTDKPDVMTGATALSDGEQGFVPMPVAGDEHKVLTGKGTFEFMSGVSIGAIEFFGMATPPPGYLKADGAAVGRATYPELYAAIGTTFGAGDGSTTFNLPNLIGRHAKGSLNVGEYIEPGLPNIRGTAGIRGTENASTYNYDITGCVTITEPTPDPRMASLAASNTQKYSQGIIIDASRSSSIYGASNTVDVATNPGLIDITALANEIAGKVDRYIDNKPVSYVVDAYNDGASWWRKWSDGWLEQGGKIIENTDGKHYYNLLLPYRDTNYHVLASILTGAYFYIGAMSHSQNQFSYEGIGHTAGAALAPYHFYWRTTGCGA